MCVGLLKLIGLSATLTRVYFADVETTKTVHILFSISFLFHFSDSKSCLSGLNWPRSGKKSEFLALFWLVEGTLGIGWK